MSIAVDSHALRANTLRMRRVSAAVPARVEVAVVKTAHQIEGDAKDLAPVDTGFLKNSISSTITGRGLTVAAVVGPTAEYGIYQELGTSRMAAQPYLAPAFDRRVGPLMAAVEHAATEGA